MSSMIARYRDVAHYAAGYHPALFYSVARLRGGVTVGRPVDDDTEIVIEGYPRSGNTFATHAFTLAQEQAGRLAPRLADHVHVPAQVMRATNWRLPTIVVVREPEAVLRSLVVKHPFIRPRDGLRGWWLFHRVLLSRRRRFVVAPFGQVVSDFGAVIDRVNALFGTQFARFSHTEENVARAFARIEAGKALLGQNALEIARPDPAKEAAKREVVIGECDGLLARCRRLYDRFTEGASLRVS